MTGDHVTAGSFKAILATANPSLPGQLIAAVPLALAACVYPPALAVVAYYLSRESPRRLVFSYYAGAFVMTLSVGVAGILFLGGVNINPKHHHLPSASVDLALGAAMLVLALLIARRKPGPPKTKAPKEHRSGGGGAVLLGVVMWTPSLFYLSAMKLISDAGPSAVEAILSAVVLTVCVLLLLELAIALFLRYPEAAVQHIQAFNGWLHRHARTILSWGFALGGAFMVAYGTVRLVRA
jgi:hypothetical protein